MAKKAKKPATKKEKFVPIVLNDVDEKALLLLPKQGETVNVNLKPRPKVESDNEELSETEAAAMLDRQEKRINDFKVKLETEVDSQEWTLADPVIPEDLKGRVWIAVYRCPEGHKTKATNRQADSGVWCYKHREAGQKIMATIVPQFLSRPNAEDPDVAKRKRAAKGAQ
jgi:hypothetical protein